MRVNNLFVYGTLGDLGFFESAFGIVPTKVTEDYVTGELYLAEWYPLYLRNKKGKVYGKTLNFEGILESLLGRLDEYEQTRDGIFIRKLIVINNSDLSWIYEANPNNDFVSKFIHEENKIKSGRFNLNQEVLEKARRSLTE